MTKSTKEHLEELLRKDESGDLTLGQEDMIRTTNEFNLPNMLDDDTIKYLFLGWFMYQYVLKK